MVELLGPSPFAPEDPHYQDWLAFGRRIREEDMRIVARHLERGLAATTLEAQGFLMVDALVDRFNLALGMYALIAVDYEAAEYLQQAFRDSVEKVLNVFRTYVARNPDWNRHGQFARLKLRLTERQVHWGAEAMTRARLNLEQSTAEAPVALPNQATSSTGPLDRSVLGRNLDHYRKECGWSFDQLAEQIGKDKKSVLGHVNDGKGAHPATLKAYALAFSRGLGRPISVEDLEKST